MKIACRRGMNAGRTWILALVAMSCIVSMPGRHVSAQGAGAAAENTGFGIRQFPRLYQNESNPVIQNVFLSGRFQHDFSLVDADQGSHDEWNVRRFRAGAKARLFRNFTLHGEVDLNPQEGDPVYNRITDLYLMWSRSDVLELTAGKQGVPFTMEGSTSSKELLTVDRSNLANNLWFPQEYLPGVSAAGESANWTYHLGLYSAGRANREFGEFNGSVAALAIVGYDFARQLGANEARLAANYVYQDPDRENTFTRPLQHVVSINFKFDRDRWGLRSDISAASGYLGQSDVWGIMVMPFVNVTRKLQVVGRHTYLDSEEPNGLHLPTYENRVVSGRGDRYNELYLGANYYFYGHRLKLQSGLQVADMNDRADDGGAYSGVSWTNGLRVSW